jgi:hypothetical protein
MRQEQEMGDKTPPFTRDDVEIEYFTAEWGAPCAFVTVRRPGSWYENRRYGLRSSKGLEHATKKSDWQYLVDQEPPKVDSTTRLGEFLGSMGTGDLEKAIDGLIADFTKWDNDQRDRSAIGQAVAELREVLGEMDEWNPIRTSVTLRSCWPRARELFLQVGMALFEPPAPDAVPAPPMWPWYSRIALIDVRSVDGRTLRDGHYRLRDGGIQLWSPSRGHEMRDWLGTVDSLQGDGRGGLWAYGTAADREVARQLCDGQLFASTACRAARYEQGGPSGGVARTARLPAGQHPWGLGEMSRDARVVISERSAAMGQPSRRGRVWAW